MSFLPPGYKPPDAGGNYLKVKDGKPVKLRVLDSPILGSVGWRQDGERRVPVRKPMGEDFGDGEVLLDAKNRIRHFWAMPVWNYNEKRVQVWEITQITVMDALSGLDADPDWGPPLDYDVRVTRTGEGMDTTYAVVPLPKRPLDADADAAWSDVRKAFDITLLFSGGDPFSAEAKSSVGHPRNHFFGLLKRGVDAGMYDASITGKDGRAARRSLVALLIGRECEPADMTPDDWALVNHKLEAAIIARTSDEDIPF